MGANRRLPQPWSTDGTVWQSRSYRVRFLLGNVKSVVPLIPTPEGVTQKFTEKIYPKWTKYQTAPRGAKTMTHQCVLSNGQRVSRSPLPPSSHPAGLAGGWVDLSACGRACRCARIQRVLACAGDRSSPLGRSQEKSFIRPCSHHPHAPRTRDGPVRQEVLRSRTYKATNFETYTLKFEGIKTQQ